MEQTEDLSLTLNNFYGQLPVPVVCVNRQWAESPLRTAKFPCTSF